MSLVPEKRLDKNNRLVTRHVLANPPAKSAASLPAPVPAVKPARVDKPKIRAAQKKQRSYAIIVDIDVDDLLVDPEELDEMISGGAYYVFSASEVESYAVLGATENVGDALHMLSMGVRTAEEAYAFLAEHQAEHLAVDNSALMNDLLDRNVDSDNLVQHKARLMELFPDTEHLADLIEINSIRSFRTQCHGVEPFIADGDIDFADIKAIGMDNFKSQSQNRLLSTVEALVDLKTNPDTKISTDDIAWLIDKVCNSWAGDTSREYEGAITALVSEGREAIETIRKFDTLTNLIRSYGRREYPEHVRRAVYAAIILEITPKVPADDMELLFDAGMEIDPTEVGKLAASGMSIQQILDARQNGIPTNLADGWL